jgi:hypothetical protein
MIWAALQCNISATLQKSFMHLRLCWWLNYRHAHNLALYKDVALNLQQVGLELLLTWKTQHGAAILSVLSIFLVIPSYTLLYPKYFLSSSFLCVNLHCAWICIYFTSVCSDKSVPPCYQLCQSKVSTSTFQADFHLPVVCNTKQFWKGEYYGQHCRHGMIENYACIKENFHLYVGALGVSANLLRSFQKCNTSICRHHTCLEVFVR